MAIHESRGRWCNRKSPPADDFDLDLHICVITKYFGIDARKLFWGDLLTYGRQLRRSERLLNHEHPDGPHAHIPKPEDIDAQIAKNKAKAKDITPEQRKQIEERMKAMFRSK